MSEHENRWPGPGPSGDAADKTQPVAVPDVSSGGPGSTEDVVPEDPAVPAEGPGQAGASPEPAGSEQVDTPEQAAAEAEELGSTDLPPVVPSRSAARASTRRPSAASPVIIWSVVGAVVLVAVAVAGFLLLRDDQSSQAAPSPVPTVTRTLPAPTATTDPVVRGEGSALFTALPGTVRQYVLTSITPGDLAAQVGALETYELSYAGALGDVDAVYSVQVTQWATPEAATAAADALSASFAPASSTGEVQAGGAAVGAFSLFGEGTSTTEAAHAVWTNGTVVLHASGPAADITNFYLAYSL